MNRRPQGPPLSFRERLRFGIILLGAALGFFFLFTFQDEDIGAAARLGIGAWLTVLGAVDLVWLRTGDVDRVFLKTRKASTLAAASYLTSGAILVGTGALALP